MAKHSPKGPSQSATLKEKQVQARRTRRKLKKNLEPHKHIVKVEEEVTA